MHKDIAYRLVRARKPGLAFPCTIYGPSICRKASMKWNPSILLQDVPGLVKGIY